MGILGELMSLKDSIEDKIRSYFSVSFMALENESHKHNVPKGSESHFKLLLVSDKFQDLNRVKRQQAVYTLLKEEFELGLHALSLHCFTVDEWETSASAKKWQSPDCGGHGD